MSKIREVLKEAEATKSKWPGMEKSVERYNLILKSYHNTLLSAVIEEVEGMKEEVPEPKPKWCSCPTYNLAIKSIITKLKEGKI